MPNTPVHFAIHIEDLARAQSFYARVFEWGFASYGAPDFLQIKADASENGALIGALQARSYSPVSERVIGLECTIGVADVDEIIRRVQASGGQILMPKTAIPYVGWVTKFLDTEGNLMCAMQADPAAR